MVRVVEREKERQEVRAMVESETLCSNLLMALTLILHFQGFKPLLLQRSQGSTHTFLTLLQGVLYMVQIPIGMALVGIQIATRLVTATLSARPPGGQQMVLTTSMSDGCGRMASATAVATANRMHACARAWATFLVLQFWVLGIHSRRRCLLRS